jgi:AcrR family transcriptional regulator
MPENEAMPPRTPDAAATSSDADCAGPQPVRTPEPGPARAPGLRERKKARTRQAIRAAAYRLFAEHGYDATPVDRIAAAADVSPSTVFRYFPTKEDIVLSDDYGDDLMAGELRARPADEPPLASVRAVMHERMRRVLADPAQRAAMVQREQLVRDVPAIRARAHEAMSLTGRRLGGVIADRTGRATDALEVRVFTAAVFSVVHEATMFWVEKAPEDDLLTLLDRSFRLLNRGLEL